MMPSLRVATPEGCATLGVAVMLRAWCVCVLALGCSTPRPVASPRGSRRAARGAHRGSGASRAPMAGQVAVASAVQPASAVHPAAASAAVSGAAGPGQVAVDEAPRELPSGCLAWSGDGVACMVGAFVGAEPDPWGVHLLTEGAAGFVAMEAVSGEPSPQPGVFEPTRASWGALRARLDASGYAPIGARVRHLDEGFQTLDVSLGAELRRETRSAGGPNAAPRYSDAVVLSRASRRVSLGLFDERPIAHPEVSAALTADGARCAIWAVGEVADEGEYGRESVAWWCETATLRCVGHDGHARLEAHAR